MAFLSLSLSLILISLLFHLSGSSETTVKFLPLHDSSPQTLQALSHTNTPVAVYVSDEHLIEVSSSVIGAEKWLKTHILNHYPSTKITTIVVGHNVLCNQTLGHVAGFILPSLRNLHHSLTRWGLEREIEVSPCLSSDCLRLNPFSSQTLIKSLLNFLGNTNYSYSINSSPTEDALFSVLSHAEWVKKLGFPNLGKINLLKVGKKESKHIKLRRLSSMGNYPFPPRPTPLSPSLNPTHAPVSYSVPAFGSLIPVPPPELPPLVGPSSPPHYESPNLPPCNPNPSPRYVPIAPAPEGEKSQLWCVAKPSVPAETLQEAMDYACGEGGADCGAIGPHGSCYYPDTVVAHASYAFNSYWQKNKRNGGTCVFGDTAMLINADPSFNHCRFILT